MIDILDAIHDVLSAVLFGKGKEKPGHTRLWRNIGAAVFLLLGLFGVAYAVWNLF